MLLLLLACTTPADSSGETSGDRADTSDTADTDTGGTETADSHGPTADPVCGIQPADDWWWMGECPGMTTPCIIEMDGCTMTITYPSAMTMGMPYGAGVAGDKVKFTDAKITGCRGNRDSENRISGACDGGCTFVLQR